MASFREMPWLAVPFGHAQRRRRLSEFFEVEDSDLLVLLSEMGEVITCRLADLNTEESRSPRAVRP